ncbi:hypothetical protein, partial [Stenotrophomonas maltophilia]|uniref:hypothetical protein n=1 Tax=Stenotrophomonas maltophilia TaxID=40324 RepID=UPI0019548D78
IQPIPSNRFDPVDSIKSIRSSRFHRIDRIQSIERRRWKVEWADSPHNPPHLFSIFHRFLKRPVIGADQHGHVAAEWAGRPSAAAGV